MGIDWYDMIARRNGGYKGSSVYTIEGTHSEDIFEERLIQMLPLYNSVLDAGCGHGEFTLQMSKYADSSSPHSSLTYLEIQTIQYLK